MSYSLISALTNSCIVEKNKKAGTLAPFDPSGHYIHPKSRIRHTIVINPKRVFAKNPALKFAPRMSGKKANSVYADSEPEEISHSEGEDADDDDE